MIVSVIVIWNYSRFLSWWCPFILQHALDHLASCTRNNGRNHNAVSLLCGFIWICAYNFLIHGSLPALSAWPPPSSPTQNHYQDQSPCPASPWLHIRSLFSPPVSSPCFPLQIQSYYPDYPSLHSPYPASSPSLCPQALCPNLLLRHSPTTH